MLEQLKMLVLGAAERTSQPEQSKRKETTKAAARKYTSSQAKNKGDVQGEKIEK